MGKTAKVILGTALVGLVLALGWCNNKNKKTINWQGTKIGELETKVQKDFVRYLEISKGLKEKDSLANFYSDSLKKTLISYNNFKFETKSFRNNHLGLLNKLKKAEKEKRELLTKLKDYDSQKQKEIQLRNQEYSVLENKYGELLNLYEKKSSEKVIENEINILARSSKNFNIKNQNIFRNWKSLPPKLFDINEKSISFKDNDPKDMEAFALYHESGRLEPLKKISEGNKIASFAYPLKFLELQEGAIEVYAIDRHKNESGKRTIYKSDGVISRKEIVD